MKSYRTCPKCKFDKCWINAPKCEKCFFDFKLGRKVRQVKIEIIDDDDDLVPIVEEKPKNYAKACPDCNKSVFHTAPICEYCKYNFKTGQSKRQQEAAEPDLKAFKEETRVQIGYKPSWPFFLKNRPEWMDDFQSKWHETAEFADNKLIHPAGGDETALRHWANQFIRNFRQLINPYPFCVDCIFDYADLYTLNENIHAARWKLQEWYGFKVGISSWTWTKDKRVIKGELLTSNEVASVYRHDVTAAMNSISVERLLPNGKSYFSVVPLSEYKATDKMIVFKMGNGYTSRLLPPKWNKMSEQNRKKWTSQQPGVATVLS